MAKLTIPEHYRDGLGAIRTLDDKSVQEIRDALEGVKKFSDVESVSSTPNDVAVNAITAVSATKTADTKRIAEAVAALYGVKSARDMSTEDFVEEVCDAMESLPSENQRLPHTERQAFREKLLIILGAELFGLVAKVYDLATEDERTFCQARILTDLRPVFGPKIQDGARAMIVMHHLKFAYHEGSKEHKNFYITLDADDLRTLKQLIERAESKAKALKSVVPDVRTFGASKE